MSEEDHYIEPLEEIEESNRRKESVPTHIERIDASLEELTTELMDLNSKVDRLVEDAEKQIEFLQSIDHAHYYRTSDETIYLSRILIALVILILVQVTYFISVW